MYAGWRRIVSDCESKAGADKYDQNQNRYRRTHLRNFQQRLDMGCAPKMNQLDVKIGITCQRPMRKRYLRCKLVLLSEWPACEVVNERRRNLATSQRDL